uniref:transposase n=1 Tax=Phocaeicola vulgatus TaxID=821 RepID=UPI00402A27BD
MTIQRKINFTQMERYGTHCEQTYRTNFNRGRAKCIDWVKFNLALCRRYLNMDGLLAIAIDPSYISKSGKKTPHIGTFWSGCASSMKHGLEIMGLALVDVHANSCMMLRAHQTPSTGELKMRNMTLVQHYIAVIKRYKKDLLKVTDIVVADAFFSIRPFVDGIKECGFHLVSRFRDTASLYYVYTGPRSNKPGRPKTLDGKINYKKLDLTRMAELHIEGLEGTAYTLIAYSKALKQKVRLVIWVMPNGKHKLFFSTKTSMSGEEVLRTYRSRFQIEFCFRDAKQYTGLTHCQARHKNQLDFLSSTYKCNFLGADNKQ